MYLQWENSTSFGTNRVWVLDGFCVFDAIQIFIPCMDLQTLVQIVLVWIWCRYGIDPTNNSRNAKILSPWDAHWQIWFKICVRYTILISACRWFFNTIIDVGYWSMIPMQSHVHWSNIGRYAQGPKPNITKNQHHLPQSYILELLYKCEWSAHIVHRRCLKHLEMVKIEHLMSYIACVYMICANGHLFLTLGTPICIWVALGYWKESKLTPKCMGESISNQRCIKKKQRESWHSKRKLQIVKKLKYIYVVGIMIIVIYPSTPNCLKHNFFQKLNWTSKMNPNHSTLKCQIGPSRPFYAWKMCVWATLFIAICVKSEYI